MVLNEAVWLIIFILLFCVKFQNIIYTKIFCLRLEKYHITRLSYSPECTSEEDGWVWIGAIGVVIYFNRRVVNNIQKLDILDFKVKLNFILDIQIQFPHVKQEVIRRETRVNFLNSRALIHPFPLKFIECRGYLKILL